MTIHRTLRHHTLDWDGKIKELKAKESFLNKDFGIKVRWIEESYTSQLATDLVKEYPSHSRDAFAATIILQCYLNQL